MSAPEGRLSRWSRLKRSGGDESVAAEPQPDQQPDQPGPARQGSAAPVGLTDRGFVQPLPPLASPEEGETAYEAAPADALALLDADAASRKAFPVPAGGEDDGDEEPGDLTPEQVEATKDLPPVESLTKDSDFKPFFATNVPDFLKRRAFKALWASSPFFKFRDGLDDYDENFRIIDKLISAADSAYRPGKGYDFGEDADEEDDLGDGEGDDVTEGGSKHGQEQQAAAADGDGDDSSAETDSETPKEPRKSDVRPPDDAV
jgi:hypothetical protein